MVLPSTLVGEHGKMSIRFYFVTLLGFIFPGDDSPTVLAHRFALLLFCLPPIIAATLPRHEQYAHTNGTVHFSMSHVRINLLQMAR